MPWLPGLHQRDGGLGLEVLKQIRMARELGRQAPQQRRRPLTGFLCFRGLAGRLPFAAQIVIGGENASHAAHGDVGGIVIAERGGLGGQEHLAKDGLDRAQIGDQGKEAGQGACLVRQGKRVDQGAGV